MDNEECGWIELNGHIAAISNGSEDWDLIRDAKAYFDGLENTALTKALKKYTAIMIEANEDERLCNSPLADERNHGWNLKDMVLEAEKLLKQMDKNPENWETATKRKVKRFIETYAPMMDKKANAKH